KPRLATDCAVFSIIGRAPYRLATACGIFAQRYPQVDSARETVTDGNLTPVAQAKIGSAVASPNDGFAPKADATIPAIRGRGRSAFAVLRSAVSKPSVNRS